jgi:hypothetical protein
MVGIRRNLKDIRKKIISEDFDKAHREVKNVLESGDGIDFEISRIKDLAETLKKTIQGLEYTVSQCKKFRGSTPLIEFKTAALTQTQQALKCISSLRTILRKM